MKPQRNKYKTQEEYVKALTKFYLQSFDEQVEREYQRLLKLSQGTDDENQKYDIPEDSPCRRCPKKLECPYIGQTYRAKQLNCLMFFMLKNGKIDPVENSITEVTRQEVRTFIKQHKN